MSTALKTKLETLLRTNQARLDARLWDRETGVLNQTMLVKLAEETDPELVALLLADEGLRKKFFVEVGGVVVFKRDEFRFFIEENKIDNSYTDYKNRIGLSDGRRFLRESGEVVLSWPYKDCVLEGGQSTEEGKETYFEKNKGGGYKEKRGKRKEIFFNEVLAADEIDRLTEEKALVHWQRFSVENTGPCSVQKINRDENGLIKENLIIKGNNLLALHSLRRQFAGRVKLIYIDPPYNTGNDGFKYNDKFNHSTWLTFMKNRLEVARELLREDGVIFVSCDDSEQAYLKVLMDEVFGRGNFVVNFTWQTKKGAQGIVTQNMVVNNHENLIVFAKDKPQFQFKGMPREDTNFNNPDNDPRGKWKRQYLQRFGQGFSKKTIINPDNKMSFTFETPYSQKKLQNWIEEKVIIFPNSKEKYPARKEFLSEYSSNQQLVSSLGLYSTKANTEELYKLFGGKKIFRNPKPEKLIYFIVEQVTNTDDLVLDYHLGSGTTAAVAHKMGRQYIGIEQMDYIQSVAVERLKKVIGGESGGISKAVGWQGGGSFVYCELAKWNQAAKEHIAAAENLDALKALFTTLTEKYFLNYNLKIAEFQRVAEEVEFKALTLVEQKRMFAAMLDNNQLYVNRSEMEDSQFKTVITPTDLEMTRGFYN